MSNALKKRGNCSLNLTLAVNGVLHGFLDQIEVSVTDIGRHVDVPKEAARRQNIYVAGASSPHAEGRMSFSAQDLDQIESCELAYWLCGPGDGPASRHAFFFALPALRLVEFPLQPFFVSWLDALGFGSCQSALKPGIPGAPPPGPHAKATEWYRHVKTSATAAETMSFVATTRSPALASNRSTGLSMYGPMALDQDQQSEIASLRSRHGRNAPNRSVWRQKKPRWWRKGTSAAQ